MAHEETPQEAHVRRHPHDLKPRPGFQLVRLGGYDTRQPMSQRTYVEVKTGYGEGARAQRARLGQPNVRKILHKALKQARTGRRVRIVLPPASRVMRDILNQQEAAARAQKGA